MAKGLWILLFGLGLGAGGLALTNPDEAAYEAFATDLLVNMLVAEACNPTPSQVPNPLLANILDETCRSLAHQGRPAIASFISHNTQRQNLYLFSLYETQVPTRTIHSVGIFNRFFIYDQRRDTSTAGEREKS